MQILFDTFENIRKNPFKSIVTFLSVGVGVGILIFALSISQLFTQLLDEKINADGVVLTVSNTELQSDGSYDRVRPGELDMNASDIVANSVDGVKSAAVIVPGLFNEIGVDGKKYRIRNAVGSTEVYLDIMDLDIIAGSPMTETDVDKGLRKMWMTESTAIILFGSADSAIDKQVQPPANNRGPGARESRTQPAIYTVAGVYQDADELKRTAYGIADLLVPYTATLPSGVNTERMMQFFASTFILKVNGNDNAEGQIRDVIGFEYGDEVSLNVWEGTMQAPSTILQETRDSVRLLTLIINLLGFILLISGAIGILSIMLVEIIGKNRDISLERALGASIPRIVKKFLTQALMLSGISALIGIVLAYFFAAPLAETVSSVFQGLSPSEFEGSIINPFAVVVGVLSALVFGGLFGVLPLFSLVKRPIAEGLRDA